MTSQALKNHWLRDLVTQLSHILQLKHDLQGNEQPLTMALTGSVWKELNSLLTGSYDYQSLSEIHPCLTSYSQASIKCGNWNHRIHWIRTPKRVMQVKIDNRRCTCMLPNTIQPTGLLWLSSTCSLAFFQNKETISALDIFTLISGVAYKSRHEVKEYWIHV